MKKSRMNKKSGFTLVEIIVGVTILALVMMTGTASFLSLMKTKGKTEAVEKVSHVGTQTILKMQLLLKDAKEIVNSDLTGSYHSLTVRNYDNEEITFKLCGRGLNGKLCYEMDDGVNVETYNFTSSGYIIVDFLKFEIDEQPGKPDVIKVRFKIHNNTQDSFLDYEQVFRTYVSLRNY